MQNLNGTIDGETLERIRIKRQEAQKALILMTKRMKIHQKVYDLVKVDYTKALRRYQKLDMTYAMNTKVIIIQPKTEKKFRKRKTCKNIMPGKVKALLKSLPEDARKRIIAAYED